MGIARPARHLGALFTAGVARLAAAACLVQPGVPSEKAATDPRPSAVFGMSTVLSGPASSLGTSMRSGVLAAFEESNADPASKLRLKLEVRDDGYDPARTGTQVRSLLESHQVLGLVGDVGTPTAVVALPICREASAPFIGAFTGAKVLRASKGGAPAPDVFNLRAGYSAEVDQMVDALLDRQGLAIEDIGFFTQRDAYGDAGYRCGIEALTRRNEGRAPTPVHCRYERNTVRIESALADCLIAARRPKAIIMVGTYAPCAAFIRAAKEMGYAPTYLCLSFVGADALAKELGRDGEGVIVTEVVPTLDSGAPIIPAFKAALSGLPSDVRVEPNLVALEGYAVGRMVAKALAGRGEPPDRRGVARALEELGAFDIGLGAPTALSGASHDACGTIWPSIIREGQVRAYSWSEMRPAVAAATNSEEARDAAPRTRRP